MITNETTNQISITIAKNFFQEMFQEQKLQQERLFEAQEAIASIISSNTTITNQRLDQLSEKIDKNTKKLIDIETENKEIAKCIDAFEDVIDNEMNKMNERINNSENNIKHAKKLDKEKKNKEMRNLLRIQEDRRNNIRVEGTMESPQESWNDMKEKLHKLFKEHSGTENVKSAYRVDSKKRTKNRHRTIFCKNFTFQ